METKQYLTFHLHDLQYGIEAELVQEIFSLPELIPINHAPDEVIGILNLRGQIVPIIHLNLLQEHQVKQCRNSDSVIILQWEELHIGLVVHQVNDVLDLNPELIETESFQEQFADINTALIIGVAQVDMGNIVLLAPKTFIAQPDTLLTLIWDAQAQLEDNENGSIDYVKHFLDQDLLPQNGELQPSKIIHSFYELYCPDATPEERDVFRQRADNLKPQFERLTVTNERLDLAVVGFGNEYFGLDLELVREFTEVSNLTPIPCCPNHIVGNMNLRGEIVTLVDIRKILNLPTPPVSIDSPAVVIQVQDIVAGLPVDQVLEMVSLNSSDLSPLPSTLSDFGEQYVRGSAVWEEKMLRVLDLPKILTEGELVVNEQA